jgi:hypothetical protein
VWWMNWWMKVKVKVIVSRKSEYEVEQHILFVIQHTGPTRVWMLHLSIWILSAAVNGEEQKP